MSYVVRRSRRGISIRSRRRKRIVGIAVALVVLVVAGFAGLRIASDHFSSSDAVTSEWTHGDTSINLAGLAAQSAVGTPAPQRQVYPYSVVPGGVKSPKELEQAATHDKVVAQHYAGFDFKRARVIELREPQLVYLSYRMHDRIYWTSKRIRLHAGEKVISDGKTIARTRCANQVSQAAKKAVSPEEPPAERFEQPYIADGGSSMQAPFAGPFESTLRTPPAFDGAGPGGPPLTTGYLFGPGGGSGFPPFFPPPLPTNTFTCKPLQVGSTGTDDPMTDQHHCPKKPGPGKGPIPPPVVPEPDTILLFTSGAAGILLRYRKAVFQRRR